MLRFSDRMFHRGYRQVRVGKISGRTPWYVVLKSYRTSQEADRDKFRQKLQRITPDNPIIMEEHRVVRRDGFIGWQQWWDRGIYDDKQNLIEYQSVGRDISPFLRICPALFDTGGSFRWGRHILSLTG